MNLVRIHDQYINLDQVCKISIVEKSSHQAYYLRLFLADGSVVDAGPHYQRAGAENIISNWGSQK